MESPGWGCIRPIHDVDEPFGVPNGRPTEKATGYGLMIAAARWVGIGIAKSVWRD